MEAHTQDDWPPGQHVCLLKHQALADRIAAAAFFVEANEWKIPMFVDTMENQFTSTYKAHPERFYVFLPDGTIGFKAMPRDAHYPLQPLWDWLAEYAEKHPA